MEDEYGALMSNGPGSLSPGLVAPTSSQASGSSRTNFVPMGPLIATRPVGSYGGSLSVPGSTTDEISPCTLGLCVTLHGVYQDNIFD
jgi:hypothetical protein